MSDIQLLLDKLNIPEACRLNKRLYKKLFEDNAKLDATDKKALSQDVETIRWLYTLKPATINIAKYKDDTYDYPEVAVLLFELRSKTRASRLADIAQKAIPYPLIIIFKNEQEILLSVADKRINQADPSKWVVENSWTSGWINLESPKTYQKDFLNECDVHNLSFKNFYDFYNSFQALIIALNSAEKTGRYNSEPNPDRGDILKQIDSLEQEINELRNSLKRESQFNRRTELNIEIKKKLLKKEDLLEEI